MGEYLQGEIKKNLYFVVCFYSTGKYKERLQLQGCFSICNDIRTKMGFQVQIDD